MVSQLLFATGSLLLLHAAYSCLHYRSLLKELDELESSVHTVPPMDVYFEVLSGWILLFMAELIRDGSALQPVSRTKMSLIAPAYITRDFDIYAGRAQAT